MTKLPTFDSLMNPLLAALRQLGGSGSIDEIYEKVVEIEQIPEAVLDKLHDPEKSNQTEVAYRLAWARTYLKKFDLLENSSRGVWALTTKARDLKRVDPQEVVRFVRAMDKEQGPQRELRKKNETGGSVEEIPDEEQEWRSKLHHILTNELHADTFERLTQRILRESGFVSVEITERTGDGGIDGKGIARITTGTFTPAAIKEATRDGAPPI